LVQSDCARPQDSQQRRRGISARSNWTADNLIYPPLTLSGQHRATIKRARIMTCILPRAFIVLVGWGITCGLIVNLWSKVDPKIFYFAGASWAMAGLLCFGYLHRLRRAAQEQQSRF
jgi:hypothetical protein